MMKAPLRSTNVAKRCLFQFELSSTNHPLGKSHQSKLHRFEMLTEVSLGSNHAQTAHEGP